MGQERAETQKLQQREKREAERREKAGEERRKSKKKVGYEKGRRWERRSQGTDGEGTDWSRKLGGIFQGSSQPSACPAHRIF